MIVTPLHRLKVMRGIRREPPQNFVSAVLLLE